MSARRNLEALLTQVDATMSQVGALRTQLLAMLEASANGSTSHGPEYIDARGAAELGMKRRAFLARAAAGAFPTFRPDKKRILAKRTDVVAWLESQRVCPKPIPASSPTALDDVDQKIAELLERGRLRPVPGGRSR